jgi:hypothetical protein
MRVSKEKIHICLLEISVVIFAIWEHIMHVPELHSILS